MLLVLDVGNTNTVLGVYSRTPAPHAVPTPQVTGKLKPRAIPGEFQHMIANWRVVTQRASTVDEYGVLFRNLFAMAGVDFNAVTGIVISSVVPPLDPTLRQVCERYFNLDPLFIEPGVRTGIAVRVESPAEVGADRMVNCVAAVEKYGAPCIVVDFGTATTFDVVSAKGEFLGGAIAPGLGISADALYSRTARLQRVEIQKPPRAIGNNTVTNLQSGLYYGYLGLVDGILERMLPELGGDVKVIATGGLAALIGPGSKYIAAVDDLLTLDGLRITWERHTGGKTRDAAPQARTAKRKS
jgi:type III pantothenate kinase